MDTYETYLENVALRSNRVGLKKLLGDQEAEIMEEVWQISGSVLARQIHEQMPSGTKLAYSTIVCTMGRLVNKGLLKVVDDTTKPYLYCPTLSREAFVNQAVGRLLGGLLEDFPSAVSAIVKQEQHKQALSQELTDTVFTLED